MRHWLVRRVEHVAMLERELRGVVPEPHPNWDGLAEWLAMHCCYPELLKPLWDNRGVLARALEACSSESLRDKGGARRKQAAMRALLRGVGLPVVKRRGAKR